MPRPSFEKQQAASTSSITAALAPIMAMGLSADHPGHPRHHPNLFGIKALKESPRPSSSSSTTAGDNPETADDGESRGHSRMSRRSRLKARADRSMSPFRRLSRQPSKSEVERQGTDEDDSDDDSTTRSGITPRNNAFNVEDPDDDIVVGHSGPSDGPNAMANEESEHLKHHSKDDLARHGSEEEDEDDEDDIDPEVLDNTLFNAGCLDLHEGWVGGDSGVAGGSHSHHRDTYIDEDLEHDDEHITAPNVVLAEQQIASQVQRRNSKILPLHVSRPLFERNRCTITLLHGSHDQKAKESKRPKKYIVASDGSEESSYAIEWTIGTVLRDGDETLVVSVMETDTKLDALDPAHEPSSTRMEHQRTRQAMASVLARQATSLLERTRLHVKISCQAIHAKNSRHMLLDLIDFYTPTMVIVGSRGLGSLRGILLGSTSHYLVQKSSAPVMVARKRLKLPALPKGKGDVVQSVRMRHMRLDQAAVEKKSNVAEDGAKKDSDKVTEGDASSESDEAESDEERDTNGAPGEKEVPQGTSNEAEGKTAEEVEGPEDKENAATSTPAALMADADGVTASDDSSRSAAIVPVQSALQLEPTGPSAASGESAAVARPLASRASSSTSSVRSVSLQRRQMEALALHEKETARAEAEAEAVATAGPEAEAEASEEDEGRIPTPQRSAQS